MKEVDLFLFFFFLLKKEKMNGVFWVHKVKRDFFIR